MGRKFEEEEKEFLSKFGNELKRVRKSKKLTLKDVSNAVNIKADYISKYENGKKEIGLLTLNKLCNFYKYRMTNLFYRMDYPSSSSKVVELSEELRSLHAEYQKTAIKLQNELDSLK